MFWKKNEGEPEDSPFNLHFDLDRRNHYRLRLEEDSPVFFQVGDHHHQVVDISAGGLAMKVVGYQPGHRLSGVLALPDGAPAIPLMLTVVKLRENDHTAARISKIREEDRERIHLFVFKMQKEALARERAEKLERDKAALKERKG